MDPTNNSTTTATTNNQDTTTYPRLQSSFAQSAHSKKEIDAPRLHYFLLFDREGKCLFSKTWGGNHSTINNNNVSNNTVPDERAKLVYGCLFSLKQLVPSLTSPDVPIIEEGIRSLSTRTFTLHSYETPTGLRLALCTDVANVKKQHEAQLLLQMIYSDLVVDLIVHDPSYIPGSIITSQLFAQVLDRIVRTGTAVVR
jgi:hypothetical protein